MQVRLGTRWWADIPRKKGYMGCPWIHVCIDYASQKPWNGRGPDVVHFVVMTRVARGVTGFFYEGRSSCDLVVVLEVLVVLRSQNCANSCKLKSLHCAYTAPLRCCRMVLSLPDDLAGRVVGAGMHLAAFLRGTPRKFGI